MKRRAFIALLTTAAAPILTRAQERQVPVVGYIDDASRTVEVVKVGHRREVYRRAT